MWYDPLRFILCFSVCCPLLSFLLINLCYWQFLASLHTSSHTSHIFTHLHTSHIIQFKISNITNWFFSCITSIFNLSIGLRCRFCEVHRRHLMHGGTQTIRFWGLQHVHWCEGSCCWFLRLQSRLVWDVPKALQGRQGMCGSLAGWFQVAIQAVDWFVPEHHLLV